MTTALHAEIGEMPLSTAATQLEILVASMPLNFDAIIQDAARFRPKANTSKRRTQAADDFTENLRAAAPMLTRLRAIAISQAAAARSGNMDRINLLIDEQFRLTGATFVQAAARYEYLAYLMSSGDATRALFRENASCLMGTAKLVYATELNLAIWRPGQTHERGESPCLV